MAHALTWLDYVRLQSSPSCSNREQRWECPQRIPKTHVFAVILGLPTSEDCNGHSGPCFFDSFDWGVVVGEPTTQIMQGSKQPQCWNRVAWVVWVWTFQDFQGCSVQLFPICRGCFRRRISRHSGDWGFGSDSQMPSSFGWYLIISAQST